MKGYSKYRNKKIEYDGILFDSHREMKRYKELIILEKTGNIFRLKYKTPFELIPANDKFRAMNYISDFDYYDGEQYIVEDCKGFRTRDYLIKKKLLYHKYGISIKET